MAVSMIGPKFYAWDKDGKPLAFGKVYTFLSNTNTPKITYLSEDQEVANENPVVLNSEGYANIFLTGSYKIVLKDKDDNEIWSSDPVSSHSNTEWVNCEQATYAKTDSFIINGDVTEKYEEGRRVRIGFSSSEYLYSTITDSLYSGDSTAVTISDSIITTDIDNVCTSIIGAESIGSLAGSSLPYEFDNVTQMEATSIEFKIGKQLKTGKTTWSVNEDGEGLYLSNGLWAKAITDIYADDFIDSLLTDYGVLAKANDYYSLSVNDQRLVFTDGVKYTLGAEASFIVPVEKAGWFCPGQVRLVWTTAPTAGYAVNVRGSRLYTASYNDRVNYSNYKPLEGITIGENRGSCLAGSGLQIGYADERTSTTGLVVTSKFKLSRVNVFDFDDVIDVWNGSWFIEWDRVNTIGGSWRTPDNYFSGLDYGENMRLNHCFVGDNHTRTDGELGTVNFSTGEWTVIGGSFDNIHVIVGGTAGDANVKMTNPHFENPVSTAKDKRFLSVTGPHASCVLDNPSIVIRNTDIYSTLFYCLPGADDYRYPYSGGLTLKNPAFNATGDYRPDLALTKSIADGVDYRGYGFKELVGGGGRVKLEGQAFINSQFYTYKAIPIAHNLIGASLSNTSFDVGEVGSSPKYWTVADASPYLGAAVVSDDDYWIGSQALKTTVYWNGGATWHSSRVYQSIPCSAGNLVLCNLKTKWIIEDETSSGLGVTGHIVIAAIFYDKLGEAISTGWAVEYDVENANSSSDYDGWLDNNLVGSAPDGTVEVRLVLESFSTSDAETRKIHIYYDAISMNVV